MLTRRQLAIAKSVYEGQLDEKQISRKHRVSPGAMQKLLQREEFQQELLRLCEETMRQTRFIISRFGPIAALRLAELIGSDKPDVARRAALDMIEKCFAQSATPNAATESKNSQELKDLTDDEVQQMLAKLAAGFHQPTTTELKEEQKEEQQ